MKNQLEEMPFLFKDEWWIGCQEPVALPGGGEACFFRLPFHLASVPEEANLYITCLLYTSKHDFLQHGSVQFIINILSIPFIPDQSGLPQDGEMP